MHQNSTSEQTASSSHDTVLVFAGLDPTGGAGIQADIETLASLEIHTLPIVTCLTVQDTQNVKLVQSVNVELLQNQIQSLLNDIHINGIKLGLLSNNKIISLVSETLKSNQSIPVVFDPILKAGGGADLNSTDDVNSIIKLMREKVIPYSTIITPNSLEARLLTGEKDLDDCANALLALGCKNVLITGEHENNPTLITNILYSPENKLSFDWPRQPHQYHGSGCTLASAICAFTVKGSSIEEAVQLAQDFTNTALQHAIKLGQHQYHPNRLVNNTLI